MSYLLKLINTTRCYKHNTAGVSYCFLYFPPACFHLFKENLLQSSPFRRAASHINEFNIVLLMPTSTYITLTSENQSLQSFIIIQCNIQGCHLIWYLWQEGGRSLMILSHFIMLLFFSKAVSSYFIYIKELKL